MGIRIRTAGKQWMFPLIILLTFGLAGTSAQSGTLLFPVVLSYEDFSGNIQATDSSLYPSYYSTIEYASGSAVPAMVLVRGASPSLSLEFYNPNFRSDPNGTVTLSNMFFEELYTLDQYPLDINGNASYVENVSIPAHSAFPINSVSVTGLPNHVTLGLLTYTYQVWSPTGVIGGAQVSIFVYLVDGTPVGLQYVPWFDLLDYSCKWADGEAGSAVVRNALAFGMFWDSPWVYDPSTGSHYFTDDTSGDYYKLSDVFISPQSTDMDCRDVSGFLSLAMQSQGSNAGCSDFGILTTFIGQVLLMGFTRTRCVRWDLMRRISFATYATVSHSIRLLYSDPGFGILPSPRQSTSAARVMRIPRSIGVRLDTGRPTTALEDSGVL